jgi:hypothetical protein
MMDVRGQFQALTALPLGKEPAVPIGWEAGWASVGLNALAKRKIPSPFEPSRLKYITTLGADVVF